MVVMFCDSYQKTLISLNQPEREHRVSKTRAKRTSGKKVSRSVSRIERRHRTLRTIRTAIVAATGRQTLSIRRKRALVQKSKRLLHSDPASDDISLHYNVGKTENNPVCLPLWLSRNESDPAVTVS